MSNINPKGSDETRIFVENEQNIAKIEDSCVKLLEKTAIACLNAENFTIGCEINILISDDASVRKINREFRNIDLPTDVLSFPMADMENGRLLSADGDYDLDEGLLLLGDIVISIETASTQAQQYEHSLERELAFLTSHGMFHLLGYDHMKKDEESVMLSKQEAVLNGMGLKRL